MSKLSDLQMQINTLKLITANMTPKDYYATISKSIDLDESFKKLREITSDLDKATNNKITPKLLEMVALILENIESVALIMDKNCNVLYANKVAMKRAINMEVGKKCYAGVDTKEMCQMCKAKETLKTKKPITYSFVGPTTKLDYNVIAIPLSINHSKQLIIIIASRKEN